MNAGRDRDRGSGLRRARDRWSVRRIAGFAGPRSRATDPAGNGRGATPSTAARNGRDVIRRRAAAAAEDVGEAAGGEVAQERGGLRRQLVVLAERIRQAGVRVAADVALRDARELGEVRPHVARAERAVDADAERPRVADRHVERVDRLTRQRAAAAIGDRDRDHQRQPDAAFLEHVLDGDEGGLGVERVEDRLEEEEVASRRRSGRAPAARRPRASRRTTWRGTPGC